MGHTVPSLPIKTSLHLYAKPTNLYAKPSKHFESMGLTLRENLLRRAMATAPSALPARLAPSPVAAAQRWDFSPARTLPQQTELARRAPGQGHGTVRGIHEMQMTQQGNAKQGLSWESHVKAEGPGSCTPLWWWMLSSPSTNACIRIIPGFAENRGGTRQFQLSAPQGQCSTSHQPLTCFWIL